MRHLEVEKYRKRRYARILKRMDADDEGRWITTENGHKVHLNEEGEPDLGNRHVLEKMRGGEASVGGTTPYKMVKQPIRTERLPAAFKSGSGKRVLTSFNNYVSNVELPEHISSIFADSQDIIESKSDRVFSGDTVKVKAAGLGQGHAVATYSNARTNKVIAVELRVPDIKAVPEEDRWAVAGTFAHEWTHYMNLCMSDGDGYSHYSDFRTDLSDAIKDANLSPQRLSPEIKNRLMKDREDLVALRDQLSQKQREKKKEVVDRYNRGEIYYDAAMKELKKVRSDAKKEWGIKSGRLNDGAFAFSGLYDALMSGKGFDTKLCAFGHDSAYFRDDPGNANNEALSYYVQLHFAPDKEYLAMFRNDQPRVARELDRCIEDMVGLKR